MQREPADLFTSTNFRKRVWIYFDQAQYAQDFIKISGNAREADGSKPPHPKYWDPRIDKPIYVPLHPDTAIPRECYFLSTFPHDTLVTGRQFWRRQTQILAQNDDIFVL